jgi:hypothetical protein
MVSRVQLPEAVLDRIVEIRKQKKQFDDQYEYCKSHRGQLPPDLMEIVNEEVNESIGSKVAITESLKVLIGLKIRNLKRRASGSMYTEKDTTLVIAPLERELRFGFNDLKRASDMVIESWDVPPPPDLPSAGDGLTMNGWADTGAGIGADSAEVMDLYV